MSYRGPLAFILPEDAIALRAATRLACARANARTGEDSDRIADAVLWLAKGGYGRRDDGTFDAEELADEVIARFWERRVPAEIVARPAMPDLPVALF